MITITAKKSNFRFTVGRRGFFHLRRNIAFALDEEFGKHYNHWIMCHSEADIDKHMRIAEAIVSRKGLQKKYGDVLEFLYMGDEKGKISSDTCKLIYELIIGTEFVGKCFRHRPYINSESEGWFDFKRFLEECFTHNRKMQWL